MPSTAQLIEAHLRHLRAIGRSRNTVDDAERCLLAADRKLEAGLAAAYPDEIETYLGTAGWSAETRATYYGHLRRLYRWAARGRNPWISYDPMDELARPQVPRREPRPCSDEEARWCVTDAAEPWRLHCKLAAYAGLRCIEIAGLRREHVSEQRVSVVGKGGVIASVPTHPVVWAAVRDLPPGLVTGKRWGGPATAEWVSRSTNWYLRSRGHRFTIHQLRHWGITMVHQSCGDLLVTQHFARHASPQSTAGYALVANARVAAAVASIPAFGAGLPVD